MESPNNALCQLFVRWLGSHQQVWRNCAIGGIVHCITVITLWYFRYKVCHHAVFSCSCIIYYTTNNSRNHEYNNQEHIRTKKEEERVTSQNLNRAKFLSRTKNSNIQSRVNWKCINQKCKIYPWHAQNLLLDAWTFNVYVIIVLWFCTWPDLDVVSIVQNSALYTNVYGSYR